MAVINTLGRRKKSVARVYLSEGKGKITINKRDVKDYFFIRYASSNYQQTICCY